MKITEGNPYIKNDYKPIKEVKDKKLDKEAMKVKEVKEKKENEFIKNDIGKHEEVSPNYKKPQVDEKTIQRLWDEVNRQTESLRRLVEQLIKKQGYTVKEVLENKEIKIEIDEETQAKANEAISEDGYFGVENTANRIIEFAKAISGGDKSKIGLLKDAVIEGFKQAKEALGGTLPEISEKTYDRVMELFDEWENGETTEVKAE
ncbi:MAG: hypothetical protein N4A54_12445 [Peptostreptococcaceae bacterium]|nr:hypothetical protein [Peptostreptococcaceae bacterium]